MVQKNGSIVPITYYIYNSIQGGPSASCIQYQQSVTTASVSRPSQHARPFGICPLVHAISVRAGTEQQDVQSGSLTSRHFFYYSCICHRAKYTPHPTSWHFYSLRMEL